jgi:acyl carrier protein
LLALFAKEITMTEIRIKDVFDTVVGILSRLASDWEYSKEIGPDTFLVADLGLESIDVVVLGTTIQEHYGRYLPFSKFFAEIGGREVRDIQIAEFVEFVHQNLNSNSKET